MSGSITTQCSWPVLYEGVGLRLKVFCGVRCMHATVSLDGILRGEIYLIVCTRTSGGSNLGPKVRSQCVVQASLPRHRRTKGSHFQQSEHFIPLLDGSEQKERHFQYRCNGRSGESDVGTEVPWSAYAPGLTPHSRTSHMQ